MRLVGSRGGQRDPATSPRDHSQPTSEKTPTATPRSRRSRVGAGPLEGACGLAIVAVKLGLVYGRPLCPRQLSHDDLLFLRLARSILDGEWLGPYEQLTLVKGPFLPLFLAASAKLGLPFLLSQEVLYLLGSAVVMLALAQGRSRCGRIESIAGAFASSGPSVWAARWVPCGSRARRACGSCRRCSWRSGPRRGGSPAA
jgi:hypothetical protein